MERRKHILVVDDDGDVQDVICNILEDGGFRVSRSANGALMRGFLKTDDPVDAVVLDSLMPGETSASLARHLNDLQLPMVMVSGTHDAMLFAEQHGLQLLIKPFRSRELFEALDRAFSSGAFGQRDA
jgi:DNA-binding NtrC family response regulator